MTQTRLSQIFKRKETAQVKRKQTSIDFFVCVKNAHPSFDVGSLNFSAHISMKIILVDPNLVRTFFGNNFFDPNYGAHP